MLIDYSREDKLRHDYAVTGYTGDACTKCGRVRVERCNNGKRICEKCAWDQDAGEYCGEYREVYL